MNISDNAAGGGGGKGLKRSAETRRRMSEAAKRRTYSEATRKKMSMTRKGRALSDEHKMNISESLMGKKMKASSYNKMMARHASRVIVATNHFTGETIEFCGTTSAAKYYNVDGKTIRNRLKKGEVLLYSKKYSLYGWLLTEAKE